MKKKILLLAAALMMFMGIVSASSINGDYKGNPIVKVMSNGKQLQSDEVPAQIYDGHTVVPISLLRQLGASVEWNQETYSVDVKLPQQSSNVNSNVDIDTLKYINEVEMFRFLYFANEQAAAAFQLMPLIDTISSSQSDYRLMIERINGLKTDITTDWSRHLSSNQVYGSDANKLVQIEKSLLTIKNYLLKFDTKSAITEWGLLKTSINDLYSKYDLNLINTLNGTVTAPVTNTPSSPSNPISNSQPIITPQIPVQPVQQPIKQPAPEIPAQPVIQTPVEQNTQPTVQPNPIVVPPQQTPVKVDNTAKCQQIRDTYVLKLDSFNRNSNPFSGSTDYNRSLIERDRDNELRAAGCN